MHAAVIVADLTDLRSFIDIGRWMTIFTGHATTAASSASASPPFPVLLLANKADSSDRVLSDASVSEWSERHHLTQSYVVSAKTGTGVEDAFRSIVNRVDTFVPAAQLAVGGRGGGGSVDATQRLLSLLLHSSAGARRSPSHSPSTSHRLSASLTPTSRTRASSLLSAHSLLSTLQPAGTPRMLPTPASARATAAGIGRSTGQSYSALTVQRLTAAKPQYGSRKVSLSGLARHDTQQRDNSRSGSNAEEKVWVVERKLLTAGGAITPAPSGRSSFTAGKVVSEAGEAWNGKRAQPYSPVKKDVDLRF